MTIAAALDQAVKAVCPVLGVSIGDADDRSTWRVDFADEATDEQRALAAAALAEFVPPGPSYQITPAKLWRRCTPAEAVTLRDVLLSFEASQDPVEVQLAMVFRAANILASDDADFGALDSILRAVLGDARAEELLAP